MASNCMKKIGVIRSMDRISNLPKEITDEILVRLPIRDAVKLSMLSTSWRNRWTSIPELVFDRRSVNTRNHTAAALLNLVTKVLLLHKGAISKFQLIHYLDTGSPDVDQWLQFLSSKDLNHFTLIYGRLTSYRLPSCLFSCHTLRRLELGGCELKLPSHFQVFGCLTHLKLEVMTVTNETFEALVLKCPLLEYLRVWFCRPLTRFNIQAPNLKSVEIHGACDSITSINSFDLTFASINSFNLTSVNPHGLDARCSLDSVLCGVSEIRNLKIFIPFMEQVPFHNIPEKLPIKYRHLVRVYMYINFEDLNQVLAVPWLCRSSPNLRTLEIAVRNQKQSVNSYEKCFWETQLRKQEERSNFRCLQFVILTAFRGGNHELGFIQFILMKAFVLETLRINSIGNVEKFCLKEIIMQYKRASANAKVLFSSQAYNGV